MDCLPEKRRWRYCVIVTVVVVLLVTVVLAVALPLTLGKEKTKTDPFKPIFLSRCQKFKGYDCENLWNIFERAYVGRDACKVPMEAYDPLIKAAPSKHECNRTMLWSKTKEEVHDFNDRTGCFVTLEDTLLGSVLDGLTWCGKEGSDETFTTDCPEWTECENNPVRSFWKTASAAFADAACGDVTAMLNGSIPTPFSNTSIFGSIELKRLNSTKVNSLTVVLVAQGKPVSNCADASLKELQSLLSQGIMYTCRAVPQAQIDACSPPCDSCW